MFGKYSRSAAARRKAVGLLAVSALIVAACGGDDDEAVDQPVVTSPDEDPAEDDPVDDDPAEDDPADDPAETTMPAGDGEVCTEDNRGGSITMGVGVPVGGVDPIVALGAGIAGGTELSAMFDSLAIYDAESGEYEPFLAESIEPNDDLTEWTVTLREGVTFGNGDPVTPETVQFSIERVAASSRAAAGMAQEIIGFDIVDDRTIVLTAASPNGSMPHILAAEAGMVVNPALVEERGEEFANDPTGGGSGPFEFDRFVPGEELVFTAKDDWWGGPVCIEELRFIYVPGGAGTWQAYQAGEMDVSFTFDVLVNSEIREAGEVAYAGIAGAHGAFLLNHREGRPTEDVRVRQAIAHAIDPELIDDRVFSGEGLPHSGLIHPDQMIYPGIDGPEFDPDLAAQLVEEAMADGWDGNVVLVSGDLQTAVDISIVVEAMLTNVGMTVERQNLPSAEQNQRVLFDHDYDLGASGLGILDSGAFGRMSQFLSYSVRNRVANSDEELDAAIEELIAAADVDETAAAFERIQTRWNEVVPSVLYSAVEWMIGADTDQIRGLHFGRDASVHFHKAFIDS